MSVKDRSLFSLSWSLVITIGLGIFQPMLDSWFLGRVSDEAAAGVGSLGPLIMTVLMIMQTMAQAGASIVSQFLGGKRKSHARATQSMVLAGTVIIGLALSGILWASAGFLIQSIGLQGATAHHAQVFLEIFAMGLVFRALLTAYTTLISGYGKTLWNLGGNALSLVINAILNYGFLEGAWGLPLMQVEGVAIATVSSWIAVDILFAIVLAKESGAQKIRTKLKRGVSLVFKDWMRIGLPSTVEPVSYSIYQVAITTLIVSLGTLSITSRVYAGNFAMLPIIFSVGIGVASQILIAHLVGAKDYQKADRRLWQSLAWASGLALSVSILVAISGKYLLNLYTQNNAVIAVASTCLWADAFLQPAKAANIILTNSMRAAGDSRFPAIVGTLMMWTLGIGVVWLLGIHMKFGIVGIWFGMALDEWIRAIVNIIRWNSKAWQNKGVT